MADSIIDYVLLNCNKGFDSLPFSNIDGLILAQLSYLSFNSLVPDISSRSKGVLFSEVAESENFDSIFALPRTAERNKKLFNAMAYSKRYGKIKINYYCNIFDYEKDTQFCAVTFVMPNGDACIAYRGTDATITGWKENCNMLYTSPVSSQKLSVPYLEKVSRKTKGKIILVGHSKGGNLAIYAGAMCSQSSKNKLIEIKSFDSPGFTKDFIKSPEYRSIQKKITKLVPEQSMIGMLLNNTNKYSVIQSEGIGFYQHDPFMWKIENNDFISGEKVVTQAKILDQTFNEWVYNFEPEQRELFVEAMFDIIEATNEQNASTFIEWSENLKGNMPLVFDTLKELDPKTRSFILKVFGNLFVSAKDSIVTSQKEKLKMASKKIKVKKI